MRQLIIADFNMIKKLFMFAQVFRMTAERKDAIEIYQHK